MYTCLKKLQKENFPNAEVETPIDSFNTAYIPGITVFTEEIHTRKKKSPKTAKD